MQILKDNELQEVFECEKYLESREQYCARKTAEGFSIFYPEPNELCLDIDSEEDYQKFLARFQYLSREVDNPYIAFKEFQSSTKGHRHIIITLPYDVDRFERLALQAVLGSDPIKEMLSIFRIWQGDKFPSLLAMKPEQKEKTNGK